MCAELCCGKRNNCVPSKRRFGKPFTEGTFSSRESIHPLNCASKKVKINSRSLVRCLKTGTLGFLGTKFHRIADFDVTEPRPFLSRLAADTRKKFSCFLISKSLQPLLEFHRRGGFLFIEKTHPSRVTDLPFTLLAREHEYPSVNLCSRTKSTLKYYLCNKLSVC